MISTHILSSKVHKIMDNTPLQFQKIFQRYCALHSHVLQNMKKKSEEQKTHSIFKNRPIDF